MNDSARALDELCINTLRVLSIDAVERASSGHPGLPMGAAPMAYALWQRHLKHHPEKPEWPDRDRFVLSGGHGSMLLYSLLHLTGYDLPLEELESFRQWRSRTPGHPEAVMTAGVEATTGPLGQGSANAVGMAMAERFLAQHFNRPGHTIVDHFTYALVSDGDLMEGISAEASSLAGHLRLGKLIYLYDANDISLDGPLTLSMSTEDVAKRYEAYGWHVQTVRDGDHDVEAIDRAITAAKAEGQRPSLILIKTTIGFGAPHKGGTSEAHGSPLGAAEVRLVKERFGFDPDKSFDLPTDAVAAFRTAIARGQQHVDAWEARFAAYREAHPDLAAEFERRMADELPADWESALPTFPPGKSVATRSSAGQVLNALAARVPELWGGDADLSVSTKTALKDGGSFHGQSGSGRNIHFGVREHAMGAIANGICYHGGSRPFTATFFCFSDYMRPAVRLAALNHLPVVFVWTHDSIGLGEDGPTHQPVEHLMALRAMPNLLMIRPGDANEAAEAWRVALANRRRPTGLVLSRQNLPTIDRSTHGAASGLRRGAYVLAEAEGGSPEAILIASGSEVATALDARALLQAEAIPTRVVSMPCWELFDEQAPAYRGDVLPAGPLKVSIEAGVTLGWERYVGPEGEMIGVDAFGASAPAERLIKEYGLSVDDVVARVRRRIDR
ncbi:MAG: transketolase [Myxococcales bacterium]|nr:transketolase [Myxococcales bacterium]